MSIVNEVSHSIRRKSVLIAVAILSLSSCSKDAPSLEKYEPEDGQCLVFIGQDMEAVGGVEGFVGISDKTLNATYCLHVLSDENKALAIFRLIFLQRRSVFAT